MTKDVDVFDGSHENVNLYLYPDVKAEYAACGCVFAIID